MVPRGSLALLTCVQIKPMSKNVWKGVCVCVC